MTLLFDFKIVLIKNINFVQKNALVLIKDIVKHSLFLAECAIGSNLFPDIFLLTKQPDECVRNNVANVIQELVKHSVQVKPHSILLCVHGKR